MFPFVSKKGIYYLLYFSLRKEFLEIGMKKMQENISKKTDQKKSEPNFYCKTQQLDPNLAC